MDHETKEEKRDRLDLTPHFSNSENFEFLISKGNHTTYQKMLEFNDGMNTVGVIYNRLGNGHDDEYPRWLVQVRDLMHEDYCEAHHEFEADAYNTLRILRWTNAMNKRLTIITGYPDITLAQMPDGL
mgnify:CR=1 FL=1